jgi:hypothetical protein
VELLVVALLATTMLNVAVDVAWIPLALAVVLLVHIVCSG